MIDADDMRPSLPPTVDLTYDDGSRTISVSIPAGLGHQDTLEHLTATFLAGVDRLLPAHLRDDLSDLPRPRMADIDRRIRETR